MRRLRGVLLLAASLLGCDRALGIPDYTLDDTLTCDAGVCGCVIGSGDCDGTLVNGCETRTTTDANNCGACGHSCLGGACKDGQCMPVSLISAPPVPDEVACSTLDPGHTRVTVGGPVAQGGFLYFTYLDACPSWRLARVRIAGGLTFPAIGPLGDESSQAAIASFVPSLDGSEGYLLASSFALRVGLDPSAAATPVPPALGATTAGDIALAGRCLYITVAGATSTTRELVRVNLDKHTSEALPPSSIFALVGDGLRIIYAAKGPAGAPDELYVVDEQCGPPTKLVSSGRVKALTVDQTTGMAYAAVLELDGSPEVSLYTIDLSSPAPALTNTRALTVPVEADGLAARDGEVYWQSRSTQKIGRAFTGHPDLFEVADAMDSHLVLDDHRIYWWKVALNDRLLVSVARPIRQ